VDIPLSAKSFFEGLSGKITGHTEEEEVFVPESVIVSYESLYFPVKTFCFDVSETHLQLTFQPNKESSPIFLLNEVIEKKEENFFINWIIGLQINKNIGISYRENGDYFNKKTS
jgi:hypothetical protein